MNKLGPNIIFSDAQGGVKTASQSLAKAFANRSIPCVLFNMSQYQVFLPRKIFYTLKRFWHNKADVFILQHFDAIFLGLFLKLFGFKKLINVVHTDLAAYFTSANLFKKIVLKIIFFALRNDKVVFVSKESELKATDLFHLNNTTTIYNTFVCTNNFINSSSVTRTTTLGVVTRLHKDKNIDLLMRVFKQCLQTNNQARLLIYGAGEEQPKLQNYCKQLACTENIKFMGRSSDKDKIYQSIDALVSFSSIEGLPTVILESICYGKPVMHTDCSSGPREIMSPQSEPLNKTTTYEVTKVGYLIKPVTSVEPYSRELNKSEYEYVHIMNQFITDLQQHKFSMDYNFAPFSEDTITNKWLNLLA